MNSRDRKNATSSALDVAVIGMAGKFPKAKNIDEFWDNIKNGRESISFFSKEELEKAGISPDLLDNPNYVRAWGMLDEVEYFDARFFGYAPFESEAMDPQIRLTHECVYEALEDAGYITDVDNKSIGLYFAAASNPIWEWANLSSYTLDSTNISQLFNASLFASKDFLTTRISFKLNLKGPSYVMNTACSSSLVAIHIATRALLLGECDMAIAGGVSLGGISIPTLGKTGYLYQEGLIVSPDGHCRAFDAESKGTVGGNGVGAVVLKRLNDAIKDRDNIYAVIKGSAINNDGRRKVAYTAPSVDGQAEVIRMAQRIAKVPPESISYIEAHGTGTQLGDPVEIEGLKIAFNTNKRGFCAIGTVKSNIGHLNTAAGIAAFIKTVLSLKNKQIPPSLHFKRPNPKIDFLNTPFYVNTELKEWKNEEFPLRAGVSSFGVGGTNAHVILEEYIKSDEQLSGRPWQILLLSAKTEKDLVRKAVDLSNFLQRNKDINLADVAYTLIIGRQHFNQRRFIVCSSSKNAKEALLLSNSNNTYQLSNNMKKKVVLLFPDQGMQYVNMTLELYKTEITFKNELNHCFEVIESINAVNMAKILFPDQDNIDESRQQIRKPSVAQPLTFIIEYALAKLMLKWGIKVYTMMGCGVGEYVVACLAGVFKLEEALKIVICRGKLYENMLTGQVHKPSFSISPESFNQLENKIRSVKLVNPEIPYISSVTGDWITSKDAKDPKYWANKVKSNMSFVEGISEISKQGNIIYMEVGPGKIMNDFVSKHKEQHANNTFLSLMRNLTEEVSDVYRLLENIGHLWLSGTEIDWREFYSLEKRRRISMPTYPFEHKRYWKIMEYYERLNKNRS